MGHTPGPWAVVNGCNVVADGAHVPLTTLSYIAVTGGLSGSDTIERDAANARLIAAAPELLSNLERLVEAMVQYQMDVDDDPPYRHREMMADARAAIAKATGQ